MEKRSKSVQLGIFRPAWDDRTDEICGLSPEDARETEVRAAFEMAFDEVFGEAVRAYEVRADGGGIETEEGQADE